MSEVCKHSAVPREAKRLAWVVPSYTKLRAGDAELARPQIQSDGTFTKS